MKPQSRSFISIMACYPLILRTTEVPVSGRQKFSCCIYSLMICRLLDMDFHSSQQL